VQEFGSQFLRGAETLIRRHKLVLVNDTAEKITAPNADVIAWRRRGNNRDVKAERLEVAYMSSAARSACRLSE